MAMLNKIALAIAAVCVLCIASITIHSNRRVSTLQLANIPNYAVPRAEAMLRAQGLAAVPVAIEEMEEMPERHAQLALAPFQAGNMLVSCGSAAMQSKIACMSGAKQNNALCKNTPPPGHTTKAKKRYCKKMLKDATGVCKEEYYAAKARC